MAYRLRKASCSRPCVCPVAYRWVVLRFPMKSALPEESLIAPLKRRNLSRIVLSLKGLPLGFTGCRVVLRRCASAIAAEAVWARPRSFARFCGGGLFAPLAGIDMGPVEVGSAAQAFRGTELAARDASSFSEELLRRPDKKLRRRKLWGVTSRLYP